MMMKKTFITILLAFLGTMLVAQSLKTPDLAYPKTVQEEAKKALKKAEKEKNGDLLVAALCQLSLADCAISQENNEKVIERLHKYQAKEKRTDILALLLLLEARIYDDVWMEGANPDSLLECSLKAGEEALAAHPLSEYPECIDPGNKEAQRYVTNLYDFLRMTYYQHGGSMTVIDMSSGKLLEKLPAYHKNDIPKDAQPFDVLMHAKWLIDNSWRTDIDIIGQCEHYLNQYPEGPYAYDIERAVHNHYARWLNVSSEESQYSSGHPIEVQISGRMSKRATLVVYALPDTTQIAVAGRYSSNKTKYPVTEVMRQQVELTPDQRNNIRQTVQLPALPWGAYCIDIFDDEHPNEVYKELLPNQYSFFTVSDLFPFSQIDYTCPETSSIVVDNWSGMPLTDVTFKGKVPVRGDDRFCNYHNVPNSVRKSEYKALPYDRVKIFSDLAIYRPGEKMQWHLVAYKPRLYNHAADPEETFCISLHDAEGNVLMNDTVVTDVMGMARGSYMLPKGEKVPLGDYRLEVEQYGFAASRQSYSFEVAEYKAPTFEVSFEKFAEKYDRIDSVHVSGVVKTLVGAPMRGQTVELRIDGGENPLSWELTTDEEGRFSNTFPIETLFSDSTQWQYWHWFSATAHVTNAGGESQEAQSGFHYAPNNGSPLFTPPAQRPDTCPAGVPLWVARADQQLESDEEGNAIVPVWNSVPDVHIYYIAYDRDHLLYKGWLHYSDTGRHELKLPMYRKGSNVEMTVELFSRYHGKSYNAQSIVTLKERKLVIDTEVMRDHLQPGVTETWRLRAHYDDEALTPARARLMLLLYHSALAELRANKWTFNPQVDRGPRVADLQMGQSAISGWSSFRWTDPTLRKEKKLQLPSLQTWGHNFRVYHPIRIGAALGGKYRTMSVQAVVEDDVEITEEEADDLVYSKSVSANQIYMSVEIPPQFDMSGESRYPSIASTVQMRDSMTHVALYEPALDTDEEGRATVTFNVPQDNATWLLEAVGYDFALHTADLHKKIVVQRPVMVKPSLPRFVRMGDKCTLSGIVQNASAEAVEALVQVEIFHPLSKEVLLQKTEKMQLAVNEERALAISLQIPDSLDEIGFRIAAVAEGCSDGEQLRLPVLPAAQPIVDSWTFYENNASDARVAQIRDSLLQVAGNPEKYTFEAVTHMTDYLRPQLEKVYDRDASTATAIAHSLWARTVVNHLCDTVTDMSALADRLSGLQNADGGYSWCDYDNRRSSDYVTATVMYLMERLEKMGYEVPEGLHLDRARQYLKDSTEYYSHTFKKKRFMRRHWKKMSLVDRGFAAQYLYEHGNRRTARKISRSLMEYVKEDDYYGGYWSLEHSRSWIMPLGCCCWLWRPLLYHDQLALNAHLVEVLHEVGLPTAKKNERILIEEAIEAVRQWMMMSKRTTDWGNSSLVADAAYALLRTGDMWEEANHPIWGALQVSRQVPVREVEKHNMKEVSVDVVALEKLEVGKKIRVEVKIEATQSMDYVTVVIPRASCLEPLRQTSGRFWQSGLWGRCETRDTETRLYIPHLTSGKHTLSFEAYVTHEGTFAQPAVTLTCEYNPQFTVHSAGHSVEVIR